MTSGIMEPCCTQTNGSSPLPPGKEANVSVVTQSEPVQLVVTLILGSNIIVSLSLNILLMVIIQFSPSLQTPPNSHLLNICVNNLLLCADMMLCALGLHFNTLALVSKNADILSGVQLFLTYNSLLQYWGTFASIGFYRHRTIRKPGLTLKSRRHLVSQSVTCNWVVSCLLAMTLGLSYAHSSRHALTTLDPFRRDFYADRDETKSTEEHLVVTLTILFAFCAGLVIISMAYYRICMTLNLVALGHNKVSPRRVSTSMHSDSSDLTLSTSQTYRPQYALSPSYGRGLSPEHKDVFLVMFAKADNSVTIEDGTSSDNKFSKMAITTRASNPRSTFGQRRPLTSTLSTSSDCSVRPRAPEFTDISIGADLLRFQRQQSHRLQQRTSFRRDSISLGGAIRNSVAMLLVYVTFSVPLIVVSVPDPPWTLPPLARVHLLLTCRILFFINAPAYPLWYLLFSVTVRKCFTRLWEGVITRWRET